MAFPLDPLATPASGGRIGGETVGRVRGETRLRRRDWQRDTPLSTSSCRAWICHPRAGGSTRPSDRQCSTRDDGPIAAPTLEGRRIDVRVVPSTAMRVEDLEDAVESVIRGHARNAAAGAVLA